MHLCWLVCGGGAGEYAGACLRLLSRACVGAGPGAGVAACAHVRDTEVGACIFIVTMPAYVPVRERYVGREAGWLLLPLFLRVCLISHAICTYYSPSLKLVLV